MKPTFFQAKSAGKILGRIYPAPLSYSEKNIFKGAGFNSQTLYLQVKTMML